MKKTKKTVDFGSFALETHQPSHQNLKRETFAGLDPVTVARAMAEAHAQRVRLRPVTRSQKEMVLRLVLEALAAKGHNIATADAATMSMYREWLRARVETGDISESYAGHIAIQWNATVRCVFGEEARKELRFKGFKQHERKIVRRGPEEVAALMAAAHRNRFLTQDDKEAFLAYLEISWPTAGRAGSLLVEDLTFADVDWQKGTLRFSHVKNKDLHETVLSERAVAKLRERRAYCLARPWWKGEGTPILAGRKGLPLALNTINRHLKQAAVRAGFTERVTSHVLRKSSGTIMARHNPRYARELADFGVAHIRGFDATESAFPDGGKAVGTVRFMSPEQALGRRATPRSDLFSAAATLYEAYTGEPYLRPQPGESLVELQMRAVRAGRFRGLAGGSEALGAWFARALDPSPDERFPSVEAMLEELEGALSPPRREGGTGPRQSRRPTAADERRLSEGAPS